SRSTHHSEWSNQWRREDSRCAVFRRLICNRLLASRRALHARQKHHQRKSCQRNLVRPALWNFVLNPSIRPVGHSNLHTANKWSRQRLDFSVGRRIGGLFAAWPSALTGDPAEFMVPS